MRLEPFLHPSLVLDRPRVATADALLMTIAERAAVRLGGIDAARLAELLLEREAELCTATPEGIAFPHAIDERIERTLVVLARLEPAIQFGVRHPPCTLVLALFGSAELPWQHVRLLARLARVVSDPATRAALHEAPDRTVLRRILLDADSAIG